MFKREMKVNLKSFLIWLIILIVLFLSVFLVYPAIVNSENIKMIDEMMKVFPEEVLKAFNMDITSIETAFGWLKTEGFIFVLLIIGCYSATLGATILLKEESDKTIEYLAALPVKRNKIITSKVLTGVIYIILLTLFMGIFNYFGLLFSGPFDKKSYILLSITPIFPSLVVYFTCLFISTFFHKTKQIYALGLGLVLIGYVLSALSQIADVVDFLKYFSIFTLADTRNVILDVSINPIMVIVTIGISITALVLTYIRYNKKELI